MKKTILTSTLTLLCAVSIFLSGCATIVNGSKQTVRIDSNVKDATISVAGNQYETPALVTLKGDSAGYNIAAEKPGYKKAYGHINSNFRVGSTIFGNILWLLPGLLVDLVSGSAFELEKQVNIHMKKA